MGKGRIVSGGTDGSYTVELLHNRDRIEAELEFLAARLTELQAELDALNAERAGIVEERNWIVTDIDTAIANTEEGEIPDVEALLVDLAQVSAQIQSIDVRIAMIQGRMLEATKRQQMLQSIPADPVQQAWCADYTEDLTGELGTVEVPAEGIVGQFLAWRRVIIRPGYEGRATYSAARDGQMLHREGQVGYQAYYNAAILPGVQRWRPQYRIGTIIAVNHGSDTCSLTIQGEDSSAQSLIIDPPDLQYTKTGVPIEYMDCNSQPFAAGDRVLVEFQGRNWNSPKVIGFETEPRPCVEYRIFEVGVYSYAHGPNDWDTSAGLCAFEPFPTTDAWHDRARIKLQSIRVIGGTQICTVDRAAGNYEGSCYTTGFLGAETEEPDHQIESDLIDAEAGTLIGSIDRVDREIIAAMRAVRSLEDSQVVDDFNLYQTIVVANKPHEVVGFCEDAVGNYRALYDNASLIDMDLVSINVEAFPMIRFGGWEWQPIGMTRLRQTEPVDPFGPGGNPLGFVRVLCRREDEMVP